MAEGRDAGLARICDWRRARVRGRFSIRGNESCGEPSAPSMFRGIFINVHRKWRISRRHRIRSRNRKHFPITLFEICTRLTQRLAPFKPGLGGCTEVASRRPALAGIAARRARLSTGRNRIRCSAVTAAGWDASKNPRNALGGPQMALDGLFPPTVNGP